MVSRSRSGPYRGFRRTTPVGAVPGTLHRAPEPVSAACRITRIEWSSDFIHEEVIDTFEELNELVPADRRYWFRVEGTLDVETVRRLGETFDLHPLALEDVLNTHQRCKVEEYPDVLFVVTRLPVHEPEGQLATEQVSMFLGDGFLVTLHEGRAPVLNPVRDRLVHARGRIREFGADYLAYAVLDTVIDNFFPVLERLGERLNQVDDSLETGVRVDTRSELRHVRADLLLLRRTIWPQRDALSFLLREDCPLITAATRTWLRDCYDHTIQLMDVIETCRELCADLRDFHMADISYRSGEVMRTLTVIATLFMPLSFIAGFYGMNFDHMPELHWQWGYPGAIVLMLCVSGGLGWLFRRKRWF